MAELGRGLGTATIGADQGLTIDLQPLFQKLKPGPGLTAEEVFADQRRRLHAATIALMDEVGWSGIRVRSLARAAGVSTSTFYRHFVNTDDCLASTYDALVDSILQRSATPQQQCPEWRDSLRTTIVTLMDGLASDPRATRLMLVDVFACGPTARRRIGPAVGEFERLLATSFTDAPREVTPPRHLVAGMTAGLLRVARTTTLAGRAAELPGLADELGEWMLALPSAEVLSLRMSAEASVSASRRELMPFPASDPSGRRGGASERDRLLRTALKMAAADGPGKLAAPRLRSEAGVSRKSFEATFSSVAQCFLESIDMVAEDAAIGARSWAAAAGDWQQSTCRFVLALCAQAARNRTYARLAFLGIFSAGRTGLLSRERMVGQMAAGLRQTVPADRRPTLIAAEASVAATWHIAQSDIAARRANTLPSVAPLLSYIVLAPITGARAASASAGSNRTE